MNQKHVECIPPSSSKILKLAYDSPYRVISLLTRTRSFLVPNNMAIASIFWLHFLNNRSSIQSFYFEISAVDQMSR